MAQILNFTVNIGSKEFSVKQAFPCVNEELGASQALRSTSFKLSKTPLSTESKENKARSDSVIKEPVTDNKESRMRCVSVIKDPDTDNKESRMKGESVIKEPVTDNKEIRVRGDSVIVKADTVNKESRVRGESVISKSSVSSSSDSSSDSDSDDGKIEIGMDVANNTMKLVLLNDQSHKTSVSSNLINKSNPEMSANSNFVDGNVNSYAKEGSPNRAAPDNLKRAVASKSSATISFRPNTRTSGEVMSKPVLPTVVSKQASSSDSETGSESEMETVRTTITPFKSAHSVLQVFIK